METIFNSKFETVGRIEKSESGRGWFAYLCDSNGETTDEESVWANKRDAIAWLKREYKNNSN